MYETGFIIVKIFKCKIENKEDYRKGDCVDWIAKKGEIKNEDIEIEGNGHGSIFVANRVKEISIGSYVVTGWFKDTLLVKENELYRSYLE